MRLLIVSFEPTFIVAGVVLSGICALTGTGGATGGAVNVNSFPQVGHGATLPTFSTSNSIFWPQLGQEELVVLKV
jgi:hypothetical protein